MKQQAWIKSASVGLGQGVNNKLWVNTSVNEMETSAWKNIHLNFPIGT